MISPLALLLPTIVIGADSAVAAPAAGYIASLIPITGADPYAVAIDSVHNITYVADLLPGQLTVIDDANNTVSTTIPLAGAPRGVAVDPVTNTIYVSLVSTITTNSPAVEVINGANPSLTQTIPLPSGSFPVGIAVDSTTKTVYVAEEGAAAVAVIAEGSSSVTTTINMGSGTEPDQLAIDQTRGLVWVDDLNSKIQEVSEASDSVTQTISLGGPIVDSIAVDPATSTVYAATPADGLAVINETSGVVGPYISVAAVAVAVDPGSGTVFASTPGGTTSGTTWIIDASGNSVVDTIQRGGLQIAANTASGSAYVAPYTAQSNGVWVLTTSTANAWSPVIKSTSATFAVGTSGGFAVVGTALPAATYSEIGALPSGITLSPSGVLSGTPAPGTGGAYSITLTATNGVAPDYSEAFTLSIDEAPAISSVAQATFDTGVAGSFTMTATGYPAPSFSETGALPAGVTLSSAGVLSGTPAADAGGSYPITITATNFTINGLVSATQAFMLTVDQAPSITSAAQAAFGTGTAGSFAVTATGFPAPTFSESGALPMGVTFGTNGMLSGTPALGTAGAYPITVTATNAAGSATQAFTLTVTAAAPAAAVGAEGGNGQLSVQAPQLASGRQSLGGQISGPPAVAAAPNPNGVTPADPVFFATGSNGELWMRSLTAGWQPVGPSQAFCIGSPAAVVASNGTLTVACEGLNQQLYYNTTSLPSSGLPSFTSGWTSLGGILSAGPAVAPVGGVVTFFARGTNGQIFTTTTTAAGYTATPWFCTGAPAAATQATSGTATFACQGGDHALWTAANSGSGWSSAVSVGGQLAGVPGIAAASQQVELFAEGTDGTIWEWTASGGWTTLGGTAVGGTGATALN